MNWSHNLIFYVCMAKDTTILAEFNSNTRDLSDLAKRCLQRTPAFHSMFSHTVHGNTYMFFIDDPFVYFGIFDESLEKHKCLLLLKNVKDVFTGTMNPNSHCFQGEFSHVFRQLVASKSELSSKDGHEEDKSKYCFSDDDVSGGNRYVWDKQVMLVLSLDLVACASLFVIWLWVCDGFQCVAN
ncbi:phytolongin Phyl2.1-like [Bidens hawaiensis]|uniref:phytolongin Phyl2.1-like n=1 Tax=Bidens hawaiensis TaxID=980011 RepID=UPI00404AB0FF